MIDVRQIEIDIGDALRVVRQDPDRRITVLLIGGGRMECSWITWRNEGMDSSTAMLHVDDDGQTVFRVPLHHIVGIGVAMETNENPEYEGAGVPPSRRAVTLRSIAIQRLLGLDRPPTYADLVDQLNTIDGSGQAYGPSDRILDRVSPVNIGLMDKVLLHLLRRRDALDIVPTSPADLLVAMRDAGLCSADAKIETWLGTLPQHDGIDFEAAGEDVLAHWRLARLRIQGMWAYRPYIDRRAWSADHAARGLS